jgi:catechol 2,3-dioxygenase-like lactoylglutathione lyase family enzyme
MRGRRAFIRSALAAGAAVSTTGVIAARASAREQQVAGLGPLDHVAVPMRNADEMIAFYRGLGFGVREGDQIVSVHFAEQKINFHRPALWEGGTFDLRAPAAQPPCGDFCWVWLGTAEALRERLDSVGAQVVAEGTRQGGRDGGDAVGESVYIRDPDGNLLEFIRYP